jgi:hypothetical protein
MRSALIALITAAALFISTTTASAQLRNSSFNSSIIVSPTITPAPLSPTLAYPTVFPASGFTPGFGNYGMTLGNSFNSPNWTYGFANAGPSLNYSNFYYPPAFNNYYGYPPAFYGSFYSGGWNGGGRRHHWHGNY